MPQFKYRASGTYVIASQGTGTGAAGYQVTVTPRESWVGSLVFKQNTAPPGSTPIYTDVAYQNADTAEEVAAGTAITDTAAIIISPTVGDLVVVYTHTAGEIVINVNPATTGVTNRELMNAFTAAGYSTAGQDTTQAMLSVAVADMLGMQVNVKSLGAVGDGVTNDTAAIQAAIDAAFARGGGEVYIPTGVYKITSALLWKSGVRIVGDGKTSIIELTGNQFGLRGLGTLGTLYDLASNATYGATSLAVTAGVEANFAAGDLVWVQSEAQALLEAGHKKAELCVVDSTASGVLNLRGVLKDSYATADTAKVGKVTAVTDLHLEGVAFRNSFWTSAPTTATSQMVIVDFGWRITMRDVHVYQNNGIGVFLRSCLDADVTMTAQDMRDDPGNSILGYGIEVAGAAQNINVSGVFRRCRHGFTTGTGSAGPTPNYGVQRGIRIGGTFADCTSFAVDTHEDSDGVVMDGVTVVGGATGGIQTRSFNTSIIGPTVNGTRGIGIYVGSKSRNTMVTAPVIQNIGRSLTDTNGYGIWIEGQYASVVGGRIRASASHGIYVSTTTAGVTIQNAQVLDNGQVTTGDGIHIASNVNRLVITDNFCTDTQVSKTQRYGLYLGAATTLDQSTVLYGNTLSANATADFLNDGSGVPQRAPRQFIGTTPPASGAYIRGDLMWNSAPALGSTWGWVCSSAGSPGTWRAINNIGQYGTVRTITSEQTLLVTDRNVRVETASGAYNVFLPQCSSDNIGLTYTIKKVDSSVNTATVNAFGTELIDAAQTYDLTGQYDAITVFCNGTSWDIVSTFT